MTEYEIFNACFPELTLTEEHFDILSQKNYCRIIRIENAAAFIKEESICFLGVSPEEQGKGIGKRLLSLCEEQIKESGFNRAVLSGIFAGVPDFSMGFFEKNGYNSYGVFAEMGMEITDFRAGLSRCPHGTALGFYDGDRSALIRAVSEVDPEWVQYFGENESVFCGTVNGELAAFCIIGDDEVCLLSDGNSRVGSIGCVGTVPKFRRNGIGLRMVELATEYLKNNGCNKSFIHYTHLEKWYGRLGYKTFLRFSPMEKKL